MRRILMLKKVEYEDFKLILNCIYKGKRAHKIKYVLKIKPAIEKAVRNELTSRQRECFDMYYQKSMTIYEIAEKLQISAPTVSIHIKKSRRKIYESIKYFIPQKEYV